jgi:hypothetical protein
MDIFSAFATDEKVEDEGAVVFLTDGKDPEKDPWIRVARLNNTGYAKAMQEKFDALNSDKKRLRLSDAEVEIRSKNAMIEIMAEHLLKDFGNVSFQREPQAYSKESSLRLMRVKDFRELVVRHASDIELYRVKASEDAEGN